ncbi:hypothetical protein A2U01_0105254, partial [Trifolium medium]|nr:hypothetical protein [Trifolium medium]
MGSQELICSPDNVACIRVWSPLPPICRLSLQGE